MKAKVLMVVAMVIGFQGIYAQNKRAVPSAYYDKKIREYINAISYPESPKSIMTASWDSIYAQLDQWSGCEALEDIGDFDFLQINQPKMGLKIVDRVIIDVIYKSPAYDAGLCVGDTINKINVTDVRNLKSSEFFQVLDNVKSTDSIFLSISRLGKCHVFGFLRHPIIENSIFMRKIDKMLYIKISIFEYGLAKEFERILSSINLKDVDSVIVDMRKNPGGYVNEMIDILRYFCKKGDTLLLEKTRYGNDYTLCQQEKKVFQEISTIIVLVDEKTASSSEAFAGCLKVRRNAKILGKRTFGKGCVQSNRYFGDFNVSITKAEYFAAGSLKVHKVGIEPEGLIPERFNFSREVTKRISDLNFSEIRKLYPECDDKLLNMLKFTKSEAYYIWGIYGDMATMK